MMPLAPGRESTTTCWPQDSVSFCPRMRASVSEVPPGENGMIMRIGLAGYGSAAGTGAPRTPRQQTTTMRKQGSIASMRSDVTPLPLSHKSVRAALTATDGFGTLADVPPDLQP